MEEENIEKISPTDAAIELTARNEEGKYIIGDFNGQEERKSLTQVVEILAQIDLSKEDSEGYKKLRNALGMIGAYDKYGYINEQSKIRSFNEFVQKCNSGDLELARMYVNKFFGKMDTFERSQIDDKFSQGMQEWIESSRGRLKPSTMSMETLTRGALNNNVRKFRCKRFRFGRR